MSKREETPRPILASWKISEVLEHYPHLLDVLVEMSPAFRHLRNPLVRRVQTRLVTVAQAAAIAGLETPIVVRRLNQAAGVTVATAEVASAVTAAPATVRPEWTERAAVAVELDVRAQLKAGQEPFGTIMQAARRVPVGQALRLRAPFEPVPLYNVLHKQGFIPQARPLGVDDWEILFFHDAAPAVVEVAAPAPARPAGDPALDWNAATSSLTIDVSDLVPPEPMIKIMETLTELPPGGTLLVHHVRRPMHLYPRLDEMGYRHETRELAANRIEVLIRKPALDVAGEVRS